jgi:hypothetical protein
MMTYGVVKVCLHYFSTSARGELSASRPDCLPPGKVVPCVHWTGGWVGPRSGLDAEAERKLFPFAGNRTPVVQPVTIPTELLRLHLIVKF